MRATSKTPLAEHFPTPLAEHFPHEISVLIELSKTTNFLRRLQRTNADASSVWTLTLRTATPVEDRLFGSCRHISTYFDIFRRISTPIISRSFFFPFSLSFCLSVFLSFFYFIILDQV